MYSHTVSIYRQPQSDKIAKQQRQALIHKFLPLQTRNHIYKQKLTFIKTAITHTQTLTGTSTLSLSHTTTHTHTNTHRYSQIQTLTRIHSLHLSIQKCVNSYRVPQTNIHKIHKHALQLKSFPACRIQAVKWFKTGWLERSPLGDKAHLLATSLLTSEGVQYSAVKAAVVAVCKWDGFSVHIFFIQWDMSVKGEGRNKVSFRVFFSWRNRDTRWLFLILKYLGHQSIKDVCSMLIWCIIK